MVTLQNYVQPSAVFVIVFRQPGSTLLISFYADYFVMGAES